jgi:type VI secretion system protein ImpH
MGREAQPPHPRLNPRLEADLTRINFYRFCQLLEKSQPQCPPLGTTSRPQDDPVRLVPHPGMGFPASELKAVDYDDEDETAAPRVRTTFMGLYGVDSPLPTAYLDDIAQGREGHEALQGFLDIFNHRILTQFYRIWRKYSYPATFEPGGRDAISQSLLGLVGLGIPGTANHIATPVSRFLALLGVLSQPGKTQEGLQALVHLLAPQTRVCVRPYCLRPVSVGQPLGFQNGDDFLLDGNGVLGDEAMDTSSQLLVDLTTDCDREAGSWMPGSQLYQDFMVMLRVYLGWRFKARIRLTVSTRLLPMPALGEAPFWLGMSGVLGVEEGSPPDNDIPQTFTTELGCYSGLQPATRTKGARRVTYQFD